MTWVYSLGLLLGRLLIAALFLMAAIGIIVNYDSYMQMMIERGLPIAPILLLGALFCLLVGSLAVILGYQTRLGALLLILFLIPTTLLFNDFWSAPEGRAALEQVMFFKNTAILGGLILLFAAGPGGFSFDACLRRYLMPKVK